MASQHVEHPRYAKGASVGSGYTHHSQGNLCPLFCSRVCTNCGRLPKSIPEITANLAKDKEVVIGFSTRGTPAIRTRNTQKVLPVGSGQIHNSQSKIFVHLDLVAYAPIVGVPKRFTRQLVTRKAARNGVRKVALTER